MPNKFKRLDSIKDWRYGQGDVGLRADPDGLVWLVARFDSSTVHGLAPEEVHDVELAEVRTGRVVRINKEVMTTPNLKPAWSRNKAVDNFRRWLKKNAPQVEVLRQYGRTG